MRVTAKACLVLLMAMCACTLSLGADWQHTPRKDPKPEEKGSWNLDGGVPFETDGWLKSGECFRVNGIVTAPDFFNNLRRLDTTDGAVYRRGNETVTDLPDELRVHMTIRDFPCTPELQRGGARPALTRETMSNLRLKLFWKNGISLRPVEDYSRTIVSIRAIAPYATDLAAELPERLEWTYLLTVRSAGIPLTDNLVFMIEAPGGHRAARVSAVF